MDYITNKTGRIIPLKILSGPDQMALDVLLLEESINRKDFLACFRLYKWDGIWLSIGKNQNVIPNGWKRLCENNKLNIVRRPTGGSAVLHGGGITYSIVLPYKNALKRYSYNQQCQWLIKSFKELGVSLKFGSEAQESESKNCFRSSTKADLIDSNGNKIVGSAQLWRKKHLLQHGEILITPPKDLWEEIFDIPPPKVNKKILSIDNLDDLLFQNFISYYSDINWKIIDLGNEEIRQISKKAKEYTIEVN